MNQDDPLGPSRPQPGQPAQPQPGQPAQPQPGQPAQPQPGQPAQPQQQPYGQPQQQPYGQPQQPPGYPQPPPPAQPAQPRPPLPQGAPPFTTPAPFAQAAPAASPSEPSYLQQQAQAAQAAQAAYAQANQGVGHLELKTAFFPLAFILLAVTPVLTLNGHAWPQKWGPSFWDLPPGEHHLQVHFPYIFMDRCGPASLVVPIHAGHVSRVTYDAPFFMFSNGTMRVLGTFPVQ